MHIKATWSCWIWNEESRDTHDLIIMLEGSSENNEKDFLIWNLIWNSRGPANPFESLQVASRLIIVGSASEKNHSPDMSGTDTRLHQRLTDHPNQRRGWLGLAENCPSFRPCRLEVMLQSRWGPAATVRPVEHHTFIFNTRTHTSSLLLAFILNLHSIYL